MRLPRILALTVALFCTPYVSEATPFYISYEGTLQVWQEDDPHPLLNGLPFSGSFVYDQPPCAPPYTAYDPYCTFGPNVNVPFVAFKFQLGPYSFTPKDFSFLAMRAFPSFVWGPVGQVASSSLPPGFHSITFTPDSNIGFTMYGDTWGSYNVGTYVSFEAVPEPGTLAFGIGALGLLILRKKFA